MVSISKIIVTYFQKKNMRFLLWYKPFLKLDKDIIQDIEYRLSFLDKIDVESVNDSFSTLGVLVNIGKDYFDDEIKDKTTAKKIGLSYEFGLVIEKYLTLLYFIHKRDYSQDLVKRSPLQIVRRITEIKSFLKYLEKMREYFQGFRGLEAAALGFALDKPSEDAKIPLEKIRGIDISNTELLQSICDETQRSNFDAIDILVNSLKKELDYLLELKKFNDSDAAHNFIDDFLELCELANITEISKTKLLEDIKSLQIALKGLSNFVLKNKSYKFLLKNPKKIL